MTFKNGSRLGMVGSGSASALTSRPVKYLKVDEPDKWPDASATEAPAYELALARTKTFERTRKVAMVCTPTTEDGVIWREYLKGSQHKYLVPCRSCGERQEITFFWDKDLKGGMKFEKQFDGRNLFGSGANLQVACKQINGSIPAVQQHNIRS